MTEAEELELLELEEEEAKAKAFQPMTEYSPGKAAQSTSNAILQFMDQARKLGVPGLIAAAPGSLAEGEGFLTFDKDFPSSSEMLRRQNVLTEYPTTREAVGFLADMLTPDLLIPGSATGRFARSARAVANPLAGVIAESTRAGAPILKSVGKSLYERPFKRIDATADVKKGVRKISDLAAEYGISGDYRSILSQLRDRLEQEGKTIGETVAGLEGKLSPEDIMQMSEGAASVKLGSVQDRENILNFINKELEKMTPPSATEKMAKYASERQKYAKDIADYEARNLEQGRLFEQPQTELFQELIPVTTETRQSKIISGNFENFPQSTVGAVEVRNPEMQIWERDIRNPNLQRLSPALENVGTIKISERDYKGPTLMGEGAPKEYLPVGQANKYSPRPQVVEQVEQATQQVPLATPSARDVSQQMEFMSPREPLLAPIEPKAPDMGIFSFEDLFDLKKTLGKKAFRGVPDVVTGAPTQVSKKQMSEIYGAYDKAIKAATEKELGPEAAKKLSKSIENYAQQLKNKGGFRKLEKLAEREAGWGPSGQLTEILNPFNYVPPSLVARAQTGLGSRLMRTTGEVNPWVGLGARVTGRGIPLIFRDEE